MFDFIWMLFLIYMLVNDAIGKHLVAPGVLYVIHKYVYIKKNLKKPTPSYDYHLTHPFQAPTWPQTF